MIDIVLNETSTNRILPRIWEHDYTVWKPKPDEITNRLGWLHIAEAMRPEIPRLEEFAQEITAAGYTHAVLLGMGGSSLAPELFSRTFGPQAGTSPHIELSVLDSTDPGMVLSFAKRLDPWRSLFIVSTKSGTTEETLSFFKYFYNWTVSALGSEQVGAHFIAITDPGSKLIDLAERYHFRATFQNDPNIGGRYSALSFFGLVPAALCGVDLSRLLESAIQMAHACGVDVPTQRNPAAHLGVQLAELAKAGKDKATFILSPAIASFGDWVEQLIAESLGKEGRGILPVVGESIGPPAVYGSDRVFVDIRIASDDTNQVAIQELEQAGFPVLRIQLGDLYELGGQFFLWELATAVAGYRLFINPFDQPNVESAKKLARQMVATYKETGSLPTEIPLLDQDGIEVFGSLGAHIQPASPADALEIFIAQAQKGDYITIQAFVQTTPETNAALLWLRTLLRDKYKLAVTMGYGPRFLHSTGQLHKGDAGRGLFIQFTATDPLDAPIPNEAGGPASSINFGILKLAQALGDRQALLDASRRVIRFHFTGDIPAGIHKLIL